MPPTEGREEGGRQRVNVDESVVNYQPGEAVELTINYNPIMLKESQYKIASTRLCADQLPQSPKYEHEEIVQRPTKRRTQLGSESVAKRRRQLRKEATYRKPYVPEPTASPLGVQFGESYERPYLKDFVKKRRTKIQNEMASKVQHKSFYLPVSPLSCNSKS